MKTVSVIFVAALVLSLQAAFAAAHASTISGHCTGMTVTDFLTSDSDAQTQSTTWQNVPSGLLRFTTSNTGCVVITFSALANVSNPDSSYSYLLVRTLLDGKKLCVPASQSATFLASGQPPPVTAASITHVCQNVAAGAHKVQVQFAVDGVGEDGELVGHTLTITHN